MRNRRSIGAAAGALAAAAMLALAGTAARSQGKTAASALPNPYHAVQNWAQLPAGRKLGQTSGVSVDAHDHVWVVERCGGTSCADSNADPILEFDASGKLLTTFGSGMFASPHGIYADRNGDVWVTDYQTAKGKGQQVFKFSPAGKLLMTLGKAGVAGDGPDTFNQPTSVVVAPNGDIFVADGHLPGYFNNRVVKFSKDGTFIKAFGQKGSGPGDMIGPHALAMDSQGRLFVGDRGNNRIEIFDENGNYLAAWKQFGSPSGLFIDKHDTLYVADSGSIGRIVDWSKTPFAAMGLATGSGYNPGFQRGIRIGSAKDGTVTAFIPDPSTAGAADPPPTPTSAAEGVAADSQGNVYGAENALRDVKKYARK